MVFLPRHEFSLLGLKGTLTIPTYYYDINNIVQSRQSIVNVDSLFRASSLLSQVQGVFTEGCILDIGELLWVTCDTKLLVVDRTSCDVLVLFFLFLIFPLYVVFLLLIYYCLVYWRDTPEAN